MEVVVVVVVVVLILVVGAVVGAAVVARKPHGSDYEGARMELNTRHEEEEEDEDLSGNSITIYQALIPSER